MSVSVSVCILNLKKVYSIAIGNNSLNILFVFFLQEFDLIERKELAPLQELIDKLTAKDR